MNQSVCEHTVTLITEKVSLLNESLLTFCAWVVLLSMHYRWFGVVTGGIGLGVCLSLTVVMNRVVY